MRCASVRPHPAVHGGLQSVRRSLGYVRMDERRRACAQRRVRSAQSASSERASERRQSNRVRARYGSFSVTRTGSPGRERRLRLMDDAHRRAARIDAHHVGARDHGAPFARVDRDAITHANARRGADIHDERVLERWEHATHPRPTRRDPARHCSPGARRARGAVVGHVRGRKHDVVARHRTELRDDFGDAGGAGRTSARQAHHARRDGDRAEPGAAPVPA